MRIQRQQGKPCTARAPPNLSPEHPKHPNMEYVGLLQAESTWFWVDIFSWSIWTHRVQSLNSKAVPDVLSEALRVQVLKSKVFAKSHTYDSLYRNPRYPAIGHLGPNCGRCQVCGGFDGDADLRTPSAKVRFAYRIIHIILIILYYKTILYGVILYSVILCYIMPRYTRPLSKHSDRSKDPHCVASFLTPGVIHNTDSKDPRT